VSPSVRTEPLRLPGLTAVHGIRHQDRRGSLRKVATRTVLASSGIAFDVDEVLVSHNPVAGTLRGLHVQQPPHPETKLLWVTAGAVFDVLVDTRPESPCYGQWQGVDLAQDDDVALLVPPGVAHGFLTRGADTTVTYLIQGQHFPSCARTLRWDDEHVGVDWPDRPALVSDADRDAPGWPLT
jgi:dTDP-4-dehydrorhamnose 3,5-epimerase